MFYQINLKYTIVIKKDSSIYMHQIEMNLTRMKLIIYSKFQTQKSIFCVIWHLIMCKSSCFECLISCLIVLCVFVWYLFKKRWSTVIQLKLSLPLLIVFEWYLTVIIMKVFCSLKTTLCKHYELNLVKLSENEDNMTKTSCFKVTLCSQFPTPTKTNQNKYIFGYFEYSTV